MHELTRELLVVVGMVALMVVVHMTGLASLLKLTSLHVKYWRTPWIKVDRVLVPLLMVTGLFALHGLEVTAYGAVFLWVHATRSWESALYLSVGAYSTAGWQGVNLPLGWRLLAGCESLNGMLLIGWSTAFLFQTLHRILQTEQGHPLPEGAIAPEAQEDVVEAAAAAVGSATPSPRRKRSGRGAP